MKRLIFDQNGLIGLREGNASIKTLMENPDNLIYLQDANLAEAWKAGPERLEELMKSLLPYRRRVRVVPTHTQIMDLELANRQQIRRREIHTFNSSNLTLKEAFDDIATGQRTIMENWLNAENQKKSQEQYGEHPKVMTDYYQELSDAFEVCDQGSGAEGKRSLTARMRTPEIIDTSILELCVGQAAQRVEIHLLNIKKPASVVRRIAYEPSFHFVYCLTKYIRVIQKFANDSMGKMIDDGSKKLGNEYFDTLNVSLAPYFDEFITNDRVTKATAKHQRQAISLFHRKKSTIIERLHRAKRQAIAKFGEV